MWNFQSKLKTFRKREMVTKTKKCCGCVLSQTFQCCIPVDTDTPWRAVKVSPCNGSWEGWRKPPLPLLWVLLTWDVRYIPDALEKMGCASGCRLSFKNIMAHIPHLQSSSPDPCQLSVHFICCEVQVFNCLFSLVSRLEYRGGGCMRSVSFLESSCFAGILILFLFI